MIGLGPLSRNSEPPFCTWDIQLPPARLWLQEPSRRRSYTTNAFQYTLPWHLVHLLKYYFEGAEQLHPLWMKSVVTDFP